MELRSPPITAARMITMIIKATDPRNLRSFFISDPPDIFAIYKNVT
jgi:hypothetical protein